jgi:asparagine synthase (glutamine-hydrolysing)
MCGILAIIGAPLPIRAELAGRALDTLSHRGPNDHGIFQAPGAWLGHRRLSVIDTSLAGHQPMTDTATGVAITFNGEIYNYIELRNELEALGHHFQSQSDTEVLLRAYLAWGENCVQRFNGDWAFLIWDPRNRTAFLARDRFAVKPLYFTRARGVLSAASEPKALLECYPELRHVNERALYRFLKESSLYDNTDCFYEGIQVLQPAHAATYRPDADQLSITRYWDWPEPDAQAPQDAQTQFNALFNDAVRLRLRSDVPIGVTLSGGLDSTAVMTSIDRQLTPGANRMTAFSSVYESNAGMPRVDERHWAGLAASHCNHVNLQWVTAASHSWLTTLRKIIRHMDGPGYSPAVFPLWNIAQTASSQKVVVLMEGQGADELLGGYTDHAAAALLENVGPLLFSLKWMTLGRELMSCLHAFGWRAFLTRLIRLVLPWTISLNYRYAGLQWVMRTDFAQRVAPQLSNISPAPSVPVMGLAEQVMRRDFGYRILPGLLQYGDTVSMANAIESRLPFLDYRLVEFCARLPTPYKINQGQTKFILREYLRHAGQAAIANRKDKKGYPTPIGQLFKQNNGEMLKGVLLAPEARILAYCDPKKISKLIDRYLAGQERSENPLYRLLSAELWLQECIPLASARQPQ